MVSTFIASIFFAVSARLSPLEVLELEEEKLMISAESRFAATSKLVRVLVEGSKKRFAIVFPRSAGTFLTSRLETSLKDSAVVKISSISSRVSSSSDKRSFLVQRNFVWPDRLSLWVFFGSGIGANRHFLFFNRFGESH